MGQAYMYKMNIKYCLALAEKDEDPDLCDPLSPYKIRQLRKEYPDMIEHALHKLSSLYMFGGSRMTAKEYAEHLSKCLIPGAKAATIQYNKSGYAVCKFWFDHKLSEKERSELDDAIESQMTDGYGENPFALCNIGKQILYLTI